MNRNKHDVFFFKKIRVYAGSVIVMNTIIAIIYVAFINSNQKYFDVTNKGAYFSSKLPNIHEPLEKIKEQPCQKKQNHLELTYFLFFLMINFSLIFLIAFSKGRIDRFLLYLWIKDGIKKNEFIPYIQPIVESKTSDIVGGEVLIRWHHPKYGILLPSCFISIAEETGLIPNITTFAMNYIAEEISGSFLSSELKISFNVTAKDILSYNLIESCIRFISCVRLSTSCSLTLCLEIVERGKIDLDIEKKLIATMPLYSLFGISFAMDDYGTGYSSLENVSRLPIDIIKIDKCFLSQKKPTDKDANILKNIVDLARKIDAKIIAEGVENESQIDLLRKINIEYLQGFYFNAPMNIQSFVGLLKNH
ncbi:hypothetical protein NM74_17545 [Aeromonas hydrophila]|uniref:EAL domain-containing protein n=1 Tax=Aeromonas hydrophila TaxID=644 RepID=UPI0005370F53|nr:EAL domain-containing protein [Aeromonas hydrophila]KHA55298.1 hypothetical protein NM74_17545 [Aeromonas hydrophila]